MTPVGQVDKVTPDFFFMNREQEKLLKDTYKVLFR